MDTFLDGKVELHSGDCLEVLKTIPDDSLDSCCCDPPYHLTSIVKRFGNEGAAPAQFGKDGAFTRASRGFMGKQWDGGDIAFRTEVWTEVLRVLKPGGHLVAFGGTRTYHRMACAIEDAGFEVRDCVQWIYGSGFPKSHDVSKGIEARELLGGSSPKHLADAIDLTGQGIPPKNAKGMKWNNEDGTKQGIKRHESGAAWSPTTDAAREWQGWGTALKPAFEPIVLARKPLSESTVAANVLKWGTGAINIDGCRITIDPEADASQLRVMQRSQRTEDTNGQTWGLSKNSGDSPQVLRPEGRWPANVLHDGSEEVLSCFPESAGQQGDVSGSEQSHTGDENTNCYGEYGRVPFGKRSGQGSAARFFFTAKADAHDRAGSRHPTVKPLDLMQWLVRLITPPGGTTLDPFAGSGTTGEAAWREGFKAVLIEREPEYQQDIRRRMTLANAGPDERSHASLKAAGKVEQDAGPLFAKPATATWDEMWSTPFYADHTGEKPSE